MLFILLILFFIAAGVAAVTLGLIGIDYASKGDPDNLKRYVGTENRGVAAALSFLSLIVGLAILAGLWIGF